MRRGWLLLHRGICCLHAIYLTMCHERKWHALQRTFVLLQSHVFCTPPYVSKSITSTNACSRKSQEVLCYLQAACFMQVTLYKQTFIKATGLEVPSYHSIHNPYIGSSAFQVGNYIVQGDLYKVLLHSNVLWLQIDLFWHFQITN